MKVLTVLGTRPEIIRLSVVMARLDRLCEQTIAYTGQNSDPLLRDVFYRELGLRAPDADLAVDAQDFPSQAGQILVGVGRLLERVRPDRVLVLGDTNSGLAAVVAARMGIPVFHMEAGNRCYDDRVPEEVNRRIIDHCSTILMPYTERSMQNLIREGIERERIYVVGNPIRQVLSAFEDRVASSGAPQALGVQPGQFCLATIHRAENVDAPERLAGLLEALSAVAERYGDPVLVSVHPRTASRIARSHVAPSSRLVRLLPPFGLFDFVALERQARLVLTDSGTVQEECAIFGVPSVTLRDVTERAETIECGSAVLSGAERESVLLAAEVALASARRWQPPAEYLAPDPADAVIKILLGRLSLRRHHSDAGGRAV